MDFHPGYRDLGRKNRDLGNRASPPLSYEHINIFTKKRVARRDLGKRASPVDRAHMKRPSDSQPCVRKKFFASFIPQLTEDQINVVSFHIFCKSVTCNTCIQSLFTWREGAPANRATRGGLTSHTFLSKTHRSVYMLDRVAHLSGTPCLLDRGTRLGGVAFCHVNGSSRAISANRGDRENMPARSEYFLSYHLLECYLPNRMTVNLKRSM